MNCSKEFFLGCLGGLMGEYPHTTLLTHDLALYHKNDDKPFGELITRGGRTVLRVGDLDSEGIKVII